MLGAAQLGLVFGEDFTFCGAECEVKDGGERGVDCILESQSGPCSRYTMRYMGLAVG